MTRQFGVRIQGRYGETTIGKVMCLAALDDELSVQRSCSVAVVSLQGRKDEAPQMAGSICGIALADG